MELKRKLPWIITGKSLLAISAISMVALALVTYTATVTINIGSSFLVGTTTQQWDVALNDVAQVRYLPGGGATGLRGSTQLTPGTSNFAFTVQNDGAQGTSVEITLSSQMSATEFSQFDITVMLWNTTNSAWQSGSQNPTTTIYTTQTGTTTMTSIQGLSGGAGQAFGFLHIPKTQTTIVSYEIVVTYTVIATTSGSATASFVYTPTRTTVF